MDTVSYKKYYNTFLPHPGTVSSWLAISMPIVAFSAYAIPPPPVAPPQLRTARMIVSVELIEANKGTVTKITKLCKVEGPIPVYSDDGRAARANGREISGCRMPWKGQNLNLYVSGAMAVTHGPVTYATASVGVVPPDANPLCSVCGPQPLADSNGEVKVSGTPKTLIFSLRPNPVSILNAKPIVWLEAEIVVVD